MKNRITLAVVLTCVLLGGVVATQLYWLRHMYGLNFEQLEIIAGRTFDEALNTEFMSRFTTEQLSQYKLAERKPAFYQALKEINAADTLVRLGEYMEIAGMDTFSSISLQLKTDSIGNWQERMTVIFNHLIPPETGQIDSIFSVLLRRNYPGIHSAIELTNLAGDTVIRAVSTGSIAVGRNDLRTSVRPLDTYSNTGIRGVVVSPQRTLLARTAFALALSLLFVALALGCTGYLVLIIFRQNRYSQTVNDYIHHVTHQLKAPISVALTTLRFLEADGSGDHSQARHRLVELSEQSLEKLALMVESLLFMSVQEQSHLRLNVEPFDLPAAVSRLAEEAGLCAGKEVRVRLHNRLPANTVTADRLHLCDAVSNLIDNAVKYSGDQVDIDIHLYTVPGYVCISVKDNGMGIAGEHIDRIFDKFYRVDQSQPQPVKGFGLGLSYVQAVCRAHGGHVEAKSTKGQGSEFVIAITVDG